MPIDWRSTSALLVAAHQTASRTDRAVLAPIREELGVAGRLYDLADVDPDPRTESPAHAKWRRDVVEHAREIRSYLGRYGGAVPTIEDDDPEPLVVLASMVADLEALALDPSTGPTAKTVITAALGASAPPEPEFYPPRFFAPVIQASPRDGRPRTVSTIGEAIIRLELAHAAALEWLAVA